MDKIAIVGYGKVGKAIESFLKEKNTCIVYDAFLEGFENRDRILNTDVAIVCVSTPPYYLGLMPGYNNYTCDTSNVEDVVSWLTAPLIIIKSTIPPGTTDSLKATYGKKIVYSPEFCDIEDKSFFIFGGDPDDTKTAVDLFSATFGEKPNYLQTTAKAAEMCKYVSSAYQVNKRKFFEEIQEICKSQNLDYNTVRNLLLCDPKIHYSNTLKNVDSVIKKDYGAFQKL